MTAPAPPLDTALSLFGRLLLARHAEERIRREYPSNEIKTPVHLGLGGEAIPVGVCSVAPRGTPMFGTYRNHALYLTLTDDLRGFFGELYGKVSGCGRGKAGSMHLTSAAHGLLATSAVVATTIPVAVGAALAQAYRGSRDPVVVFFGDGAVEEGAFWESLNFACLKRLPLLFVCEDNGLAIHSPTRDRQGFRSITSIVERFECHAADGNGVDLDEVVARTREVFDAMAADGRPGFLRFSYHRALEHVGPDEDFSAGYRPAPSGAARLAHDPVAVYEARLLARGVDRAEMRAMRDAIDRRIDAAVSDARSAPFPGPDELLTDVWA